MKSSTFRLSEIILVLSGLFILVSVFTVFQSSDFTLWVWAKIFYGLGVLAFIFNF